MGKRKNHERRPGNSSNNAAVGVVQSPKSLNLLLTGKEVYVFLLLSVSLILLVFRHYLSFEKLYLFKDIGSDSLNFYYPALVHISDYLRSEGLPKWSWNTGLGQNLFPAGLGDPFSVSLYLLGRSLIANAIIYNEVAKILLGGLFFLLYLRLLKFSSYSSLFGALLYSFSGYMILGSSGWFPLSTEAVWAAALLYSFEKWFQQRKWFFLPIVIAMMASTQPFLIYLYGLFLLVYATVRFLDERDWRVKGFARHIAMLTSICVIGVVISSVYFLPGLQQMLNSPRGSGQVSYVGSLSSQPVWGLAPALEYISLLRIFSNDLLGTGDIFKGWKNYLEAPILYCGLISLLLAPQWFFSLKGRRRAIYWSLTALVLIPFVFPFFRYLFWGFTGDYFRSFSFFAALFILISGLRFLNDIERAPVNLIVLFTSLGIAFAILFVPFHEKNQIIDPNIRTVVSVLLIAYSLLIWAIRSSKYRVPLQLALLALVCGEAAYFSYVTTNKRKAVTSAEFDQKTGYNDYTNEAIAYLNETDNSLFRVGKDYQSSPTIYMSLNDSLVQRYYGTSEYNSFNQLHYIEFLQGTDIIKPGNEYGSRWAVGLNTRPILMSLAAVKYVLTKDRSVLWLTQAYQPVHQFGDVHVLGNPYYLPLGVTFDRYISAAEFSKLSSGQKDRVLLKAIVVDDGSRDLGGTIAPIEMTRLSGDYSLMEYVTDIHDRKKETLSLAKHTQNEIVGTINTSSRKVLFFSIPYDEGWSATVDGRRQEIRRVDIGLMGILLDPGAHDIKLSFQPPYLLAGGVLSGAGLLLYGFFLLKTRREVLSTTHHAEVTN